MIVKCWKLFVVGCPQTEINTSLLMMVNRTYIQISLCQAFPPPHLSEHPWELAIMEFLGDWTDDVPSLSMIGKGTMGPYP